MNVINYFYNLLYIEYIIYEHIQQEQNIIFRMPGHVPDHDDDTIPLRLEHSVFMVPSMWKFPILNHSMGIPGS